MQLADLRDAIFKQVDWAPASNPLAISTLNSFINRAYKKLAIDAPYLFFDEEMTLITQEPYTPSLDDDLVTIESADPWVFKSDLLTTDPTWDEQPPFGMSTCGMWIEITDSEGLVHKRKLRIIERDGAHYHFVLHEPWFNTTEENVAYKVYRDEIYIPDEVVRVNSSVIKTDSMSGPISVISREEAESKGYLNYRIPEGTPMCLWRGPSFQMPTPTFVPVLSQIEGTWNDEPKGTFDYCFTYIWGYRDTDDLLAPGPEEQASSGRRNIPLWESAPSEITEVGESDANTELRITLPDVAWQMGFGDITFARYRRTGWKKRIYRRRLTAVGLGGGASGGFNVESTNTFYLIDETSDFAATWTDDGTLVPDMQTRLRNIAGYTSIYIYPRPSSRMIITLRVVKTPSKLDDDKDVAKVREEGIDCLIDSTLMYLYEKMKDDTGYLKAETRYKENLKKYNQTFSSQAPQSKHWPRRVASIGDPGGGVTKSKYFRRIS